MEIARWGVSVVPLLNFNEGKGMFYLTTHSTHFIYGYMVKDHSDSERGNPLPPHGLLFPINSKGSFRCTTLQTRQHYRLCHTGCGAPTGMEIARWAVPVVPLFQVLIFCYRRQQHNCNVHQRNQQEEMNEWRSDSYTSVQHQTTELSTAFLPQ